MNNIVRNSSGILNKARVFEEESIKSIPKNRGHRFIYHHQSGGLTIQMDFLNLQRSIIFFINIIHTILNGDQCIGGIVRQRTL